MPYPHRSRSCQFHHPQTHRPQLDPKGSRQRQLASQTQGRRMGRRLSCKSNRRMIFSPDSPADIDNVITLQTGATSEAQPGPSGRSKDSTSALRAKRYRRARKQGGKRDGRATARLPNRDGEPAPGGQAPQGENQNEIKPSVTVHVAPPLTADPDVRASVARHGRGIRFATLTAALALATVSGGFSITGMTSIFVGAYWPVVGMGVALEVGKLSAVAWLGHQRGTASWRLRAALAVLVAVLMGLNAVGCANRAPG